MRIALFLAAGSAIVAGTLVAETAATADEAPRGVLELFTSQGCSSCPPADKLATELAQDGRMLVLTLPVDYWDYLGWKDTLASPAHSARQRGYALSRGDRKVFTPQIVVNGREMAVGGDSGAVVAAVARAESAGGLPVPVSLRISDGRIEVAVAAAKGGTETPHGEVWAFAIERAHAVEIGRGENAGRMATYANVVRHMTRLGAWTGVPARFDVPADEVMRPEADGVAVLVQSGSGGQPGPILGAAESEHAVAATTTSRLMREPY